MKRRDEIRKGQTQLINDALKNADQRIKQLRTGRVCDTCGNPGILEPSRVTPESLVCRGCDYRERRGE